MASEEKSIVLGIDPGFKGGLSLVHLSGALLESHSMPIESSRGRPEIEVKGVARLLRAFVLKGLLAAAIEDVSAMPKQGVTGMFRFGKGTGQLEGVITGLEIPLIRVKPAVWKSALGLSADKGSAVNECNRLFQSQFTKKQDGLAEAALIAYFVGTRFFKMKKMESIYD